MRVIIAGIGIKGKKIIQYLLEENLDIIIIDKNAHKVKSMSDNEAVAGILGDVTSTELFEKTLKVKETDIFIAVTDSDEVNIVACQLAHYFGCGYNICGLKDSKYESNQWKEIFRKKIIPIDDVISVDNSIVKSITEQIKYNYLNIANVITFVNEQVKMFSIFCNENSIVLNRTISSIYKSIPQEIPFKIIGIKRNENFNIAIENDLIKEGDRVFVSVPENYIQQVYALFFDVKSLENKFLTASNPNIVIFGDHPFIKELAIKLSLYYNKLQVVIPHSKNNNNSLLAMDLEQHNIQLIEDNIIKTDYRDTYIKTKDDIVIIMNNNDNDSLLSTLFLKHQNIGNLFCFLHNEDNESFLLDNGIDHIVFSNYFIMSPILTYIRRGVILNSYSITNKVESIEIIVNEDSNISGKTISEIEEPGKVIIATVVDEKGNILSNDSSIIIKANYQLIIVFLRKYISQIEEELLQNINYDL